MGFTVDGGAEISEKRKKIKNKNKKKTLIFWGYNKLIHVYPTIIWFRTIFPAAYEFSPFRCRCISSSTVISWDISSYILFSERNREFVEVGSMDGQSCAP